MSFINNNIKSSNDAYELKYKESETYLNQSL